MARRSVTLAVLLVLLPVAGCGKQYWEAKDRGITEFRADSHECIKESKTSKYEASTKIYRRCMRERGWERVRTLNPTDRQFRGPEKEDQIFSPPDPLSQRGPSPGDDPACRTGPAVSRPAHCPR